MADNEVYNKALASVRAARLDVQNMLGVLYGSHMATKRCHEEESSESEDDEYTLQVVLPPQLPLPQKEPSKTPLPTLELENKAGPWEKIKGFWSKLAPAEKPEIDMYDRQAVDQRNRDPVMPSGYHCQPIVPGYDREPVDRRDRDQVMPGYGRQPVDRRGRDQLMPSGYDCQPVDRRGRDRQPIGPGYDRQPIVPRDRAYDRQPIVPRDRAYDRQPIVPRYDRQPIVPGYDREPVDRRDRDPFMPGYNRQPIVPRDRAYDREPVDRRDRDPVVPRYDPFVPRHEATNNQLEGSYQMFETVLSNVEKEQQKQKQLLTTLY